MADIITFSRDEHRDRYLRFYKLRAPGVDVGPGSEPYALASTDADAAMVLYGDARTIGRNINLIDATGEELLRKARARGIDSKLLATGGEGFVVITAALRGGTLIAGTHELRHKPTGLRFSVLVTATYETGQLCAIRGKNTGVETNLPAGTVLTWTSPPPGIGDTAVIWEDLQGGHPEESDEELIERIIELQREPPVSGNDAAIRKAARETPGVPVEDAWTYPAIFGPGTTCVVATLRTTSPLQSRFPNTAQLSAIETSVKSAVPFDEGIIVAPLLASPVSVSLGVTWTKGAKGWADGDQAWPPYVAGFQILVSAVTSPTAFTIASLVADDGPQEGQTIAVYDSSTGKFRRKRIATVAETTPSHVWNITCDTTANASDVSFAPAVNALVSPWSDSLDALATPLLAYFAKLGPGEQVAESALKDPGHRQRRQPESPDSLTSVITSLDVSRIIPQSLVKDFDLLVPTTPFETPVGTPGVLSYLMTLAEIAVYPQP